MLEFSRFFNELSNCNLVIRFSLSSEIVFLIKLRIKCSLVSLINKVARETVIESSYCNLLIDSYHDVIYITP